MNKEIEIIIKERSSLIKKKTKQYYNIESQNLNGLINRIKILKKIILVIIILSLFGFIFSLIFSGNYLTIIISLLVSIILYQILDRIKDLLLESVFLDKVKRLNTRCALIIA